MAKPPRKPKLAVWKFASCDGCQLSLLDCEDELLAVAGAVEIAYFPEATRAVLKGPYDISLVEGSVTTQHDAERLLEVRRQSRKLITIGACATAAGIQGLRNFKDVREFTSVVYAHPEFIETLETSTPIGSHVEVDYELRGCPIDKHQLLEVLTAYLNGRRPNIPAHSVCVECKARGTVCVLVRGAAACLGPVTHAGCGAICPAYNRGCYGCFGPKETPNAVSLAPRLADAGMDKRGACSGSIARSTRWPMRSGKKASVMARRTINVDVLARVEGEGALRLVVDGAVLREAELRIFEPPRFFEAFLRGRSYTEVPDITARICGICPVAYQMSAVHAMEDALGIVISPAMRELRRLLYCGEWIESHVLHMYMLHAPDFLGYDGAVEMAEGPSRDRERRGWRSRRSATRS